MVKKQKDLKKIKRKNFLKNNAALIIIIGILVLVGLLVSITSLSEEAKENEDKIFGDDKIDMYYFHLSTCPHCHKQNAYHPTLLVKYPNLNIIEFEMSKADSARKYQEIAAKIEGLDPNKFPGTPLSVIGDEFNVGFGSEATTGPVLVQLIQNQQDLIDLSWNDSKVKTIDLRLEQLNN